MWLKCKKQCMFLLWGSASGSVKCCILLDVESKVRTTLRSRKKFAHVMQKTYGNYCLKVRHQDLEKVWQLYLLKLDDDYTMGKRLSSLNWGAALNEQRLVELRRCPVSTIDGANCTTWIQVAQKVIELGYKSPIRVNNQNLFRVDTTFLNKIKNRKTRLQFLLKVKKNYLTKKSQFMGLLPVMTMYLHKHLHCIRSIWRNLSKWKYQRRWLSPNSMVF